MKIINKIMALVLSVSMLIIFAPCVSAQTESGKCGDNLTWTYDDNGILTISGTGDMTDYSEDSEPPWQLNKGSITSIVIKDGVTSIGDYAFSECESSSVVIPDSVTDIGANSFAFCEYLNSVILPDSVKSVGAGAFCFSGIKMIYFGKGIESIEYGAFDCPDLEIVCYSGTETEWEQLIKPEDGYYIEVLDNALTTYGSAMPMLPKSGIIAGGICGGSAIWTIDENDTLNIAGSGEILCEEWGFIVTEGLREVWSMFFPHKVVIGEGITKIGESGFDSCQYIESVSLPDSLTEIAAYAFNGCYRLTGIKIPKNVTSIGISAFSTGGGELDIIVDSANPNYTAENGALLSKDKKRLLAYTKDALAPEYVVPSSVEVIDDYAFDSCDRLTAVTLPQGLRSIGQSAFFLCRELTAIEIPGGVNKIGDGVFSGCHKLNVSVSSGNMYYCAIDGVLFSRDKKTLISYAKDALVPDYVVPSGVERIETNAFESCRNLNSVEIPTGVREIGRYAFSVCDKMTRITLPHTLEIIDDGAFNATRKLTDVYYDGSYSEWSNVNTRNGDLSISDSDINYNTRAYSVNYGYTTDKNKVCVNIGKEDETVNGGILAAVSYANDRKIIDAAFSEIGEMAKNDSTTIETALNTEGAKTVRVFIWDGLDTLKPLSRYVQINLE